MAREEGFQMLTGQVEEPADDELVAYYLSTARERVAALRQALAAVRARPDDVASRDALRSLAHKIAGSAGAYGFSAAGRAARALEIALKGALPVEQALRDGDQLAAQMEREFAAAQLRYDALAPKPAKPPESALPAEPAQPASSAGLAPAPPALSPTRQRLVLAVVGDGRGVSEAAAHAVGVAFARTGAHLLCGGDGACMDAAARGYRETGAEGLVLGFSSGGARHEANPWVDLPVPAGDALLELVAATADGAIVIGDSAGAAHFARGGKPAVALSSAGGAPGDAASSADTAVQELLLALAGAQALAQR